jgi:endonuclease YncB( thermonuclease family)
MRTRLLLWCLALLLAWPSATASGQTRPARVEQPAAFTLLEGTFSVIGASPDGDSVRFYPRSAESFGFVGRVRANRKGGAQLRLDGIDALETHYAPRKSRIGGTRQPIELARAASAELVQWLGFEEVQRDGEKITAARPQQVAGFILVSNVDAYGRPVAFAFRGEHPGESGDRVALDTAAYAASLNRHLLAGGFAYPMFYSSLASRSPAVRDVMAEDAAKARKRRLGIWAKDRTAAGFEVPPSLAEAQARAFVMPKLFRRLMDYVALQEGSTKLADFRAFLARRDERVLVASEKKVVNFASLVKVDGQTLRMTRPVEDLVFQDE